MITYGNMIINLEKLMVEKANVIINQETISVETLFIIRIQCVIIYYRPPFLPKMTYFS